MIEALLAQSRNTALLVGIISFVGLVLQKKTTAKFAIVP